MVYIVFLISITIHELGHFIFSKILRVSIGKPRLNLFGYSSNGLKMENAKFVHKLLVFLAGPTFNFIFALIVYKVKIEFKIKAEMFYMNLILGILNLFPVLPLDGGNVVECMLEQRLSFEKSVNITLMFGKITLVCLSLIYSFAILYLKNIWIFLSLIYLWYLYIKEEQKYELYIKIKNTVNTVISKTKI